MIKATVTFYDDATPKRVVIGTSEDVLAPRGLAMLEKAGWEVNDDLTIAYKAWLALKRQGDVAKDSQFEDWVSGVENIDPIPTRKQIEQAVLIGAMEQEQADKIIALYGAEMGEAQGQPS